MIRIAVKVDIYGVDAIRDSALTATYASARSIDNAFNISTVGNAASLEVLLPTYIPQNCLYVTANSYELVADVGDLVAIL
ncbi:hypothetical protein Sjap_021780 [Stephania japonica]|uniref:Uncharacterized protein n=1 Tax=Stephania japonica TaxID=461633 RepID=A0AAP0HPA4_9MAGN